MTDQWWQDRTTAGSAASRRQSSYDNPGPPPPGWNHAGPPPAPAAPGPAAPVPPAPATAGLASWSLRVGSFAIDVLIPTAIWYVLSFSFASADDPAVVVLGALAALLALLGFVIWNSGYRQGTTGQSLGKQAVGTMLVRATTGRPVGFGLAFGRHLAHVLDGLPLYLGYLWPLWDERRQTFADKVCDTLVVRTNR